MKHENNTLNTVVKRPISIDESEYIIMVICYSITVVAVM